MFVYADAIDIVDPKDQHFSNEGTRYYLCCYRIAGALVEKNADAIEIQQK